MVNARKRSRKQNYRASIFMLSYGTFLGLLPHQILIFLSLFAIPRIFAFIATFCQFLQWRGLGNSGVLFYCFLYTSFNRDITGRIINANVELWLGSLITMSESWSQFTFYCFLWWEQPHLYVFVAIDKDYPWETQRYDLFMEVLYFY